ncbi:MAG: guanylate kinase [Metamycoplasmataceae bacterium]
MNKIIIIAGPSGVGKGTIEKELFKIKELNLIFSVSATTRDKRDGEKEGESYYFITKEKFNEKIKNNEFLEWSMHLNNFYGTLIKEVETKLEKGFNVLVEVDTIGAINIINKYKEMNQEDQLITIFIEPPSLKELEKRIRNRNTELDDQIKIRLEKAKIEIEERNNFSYCIINKTIENSVKMIYDLIIREMRK